MALQICGSPVGRHPTAGRFCWCGLRPWLGALLTVSVPSVNSAAAYSAESTDGTLTKSATKTVFFQYSKYTYSGGQCRWCIVL